MNTKIPIFTINDVPIYADDTEKSIKIKLQAKTVEDLQFVNNLIDNDLDADGNLVLPDYPYLVDITPSGKGYLFEGRGGLLDWLDDNIHKDAFVRHWVSKVYFKNEEDAILFKMVWV